eukprot:scaffold3176_cov56-Phaeocystis_antarctica.AAC.3
MLPPPHLLGGSDIAAAPPARLAVARRAVGGQACRPSVAPLPWLAAVAPPPPCQPERASLLAESSGCRAAPVGAAPARLPARAAPARLPARGWPPAAACAARPRRRVARSTIAPARPVCHAARAAPSRPAWRRQRRADASCAAVAMASSGSGGVGGGDSTERGGRDSQTPGEGANSGALAMKGSRSQATRG